MYSTEREAWDALGSHSAPNTGALRELPIMAIRPSLNNPRKNFDQDRLQELADSILSVGLLQPIVVRPWTDPAIQGEAFEIIAGERRWRASRMAGLGTIAAVVREDLVDDRQLAAAIVENVQRQDLSPFEEARAYAQLRKLGMGEKEIAASVKRSQPVVSRTLGLLELPDDVQEAIEEGNLTVTHGHNLLRTRAFPAITWSLANVAMEEELPAHVLEQPLADLLENWEHRFVAEDALGRVYINRPYELECRTACPFKAWIDGGRAPGYGYCLNPEHLAELETRYQVELAAAHSETSRPEPGAFSEPAAPLEPPPSQVPPSQVHAESPEEARARKKAEHRAEQRRIEQWMDDCLSHYGRRELALLLTSVLATARPASLQVALARHAPELAHIRVSTVAQHYDELAKLNILSQVRLGLEAVLRSELWDKYEGYAGRTPRLDWYLAEPERAGAGRLVEE